MHCLFEKTENKNKKEAGFGPFKKIYKKSRNKARNDPRSADRFLGKSEKYLLGRVLRKYNLIY